ncbi:hypothetical protein UNDYM_0755 [Undibacterium sp. YM2]|jgi:hypothetical protein|uniref:hypothetical protein n=1 Tax=unclassified Undibacterium TaxID=2630295 RepID=UPI001331C510|nr:MULTISPECIES: hypothetical protein [unclassified Undibacterium]BBB59044.1 hypothetical protein UNDKW_0771 [Undibacterium sp. KW1]BBB65008.1 hypothetical protein UNDYM_0755 [Undibacterium sp. YM2]
MTNELNEKRVPVKPEPEEKKKIIQKKEDDLDEALDEGFPASDPVAISITPQKVVKIPGSDAKK